MTAKFQPQTFEVARVCVWKQADGGGCVANTRAGHGDCSRGNNILRNEVDEMYVEEEKADSISSKGVPGDSSHVSAEAIPVLAPPLFAAQVPSSPQP